MGVFGFSCLRNGARLCSVGGEGWDKFAFLGYSSV